MYIYKYKLIFEMKQFIYEYVVTYMFTYPSKPSLAHMSSTYRYSLPTAACTATSFGCCGRQF